MEMTPKDTKVEKRGTHTKFNVILNQETFLAAALATSFTSIDYSPRNMVHA